MKKETESKSVATMKLDVFYKYMKKTDGTKFKKWLTKTTDGKIYGVRFVANALTNKPKARATIFVKEDCMWWNREKPEYPVLIIKQIEKVNEQETPPEDWKEYFEPAKDGDLDF